MKYYSTNKLVPEVSLKDAVLQGLAADNGLYMPKTIPKLSNGFFAEIHNMSLQEISFEVSKALLGDSIDDNALRFIVEDSLNFDIPIVPFDESIYGLELFHGPTLAFKDVGARFMARLVAYFIKDSEKRVNILVATSGDTGSAVANGFLNVPGIKVFILYPSGMVSEIQEKQLTTLGNNIQALEVQGTFDDCQRMVKQSFLDKELQAHMTLTSANSINIARLIPQSFYYFHAYAQLKKQDKNVVFAVPSGNFGNLTAGLIAKRMGLPIHRFIAATNVNDIVPEYLKTEIFPRASQQTISNAMDVGDPSNFARILDLYKGDHKAISKDITGYRLDDESTKRMIKSEYQKTGYILDPHGAVALAAMKSLLDPASEVGIFLQTAHPAKFLNVVEKVIESRVKIPLALQAAIALDKEALTISNSFEDLKNYLATI